jgi:hypothetical protein
MRRALAKANENDMIISAYTRLAQMRSEIEATHEMASHSHVQAQVAIEKAHEILDDNLFRQNNEPDEKINDTISRVNSFIDEALPHTD